MKLKDVLDAFYAGDYIGREIWEGTLIHKEIERCEINYTVDSTDIYADDWYISKDIVKTFEDVLSEFKLGKKIRRKQWTEGYFCLDENDPSYREFGPRDIFGEDWEIIE